MRSPRLSPLRLLLMVWALGVPPLLAEEFTEDFAVVMIDDATEAALGPFPYDRGVLASAVEACARAGAKGVVLKFFLDLPRSEAGDRALVEAMKTVPVALQARLEAAEGTSGPLPSRFRFGGRNIPSPVGGDLAWLPQPSFLESARSLGFVDFVSPEVPVVENFRGEAYPSLVVCAIEMATGTTAKLISGSSVRFGDRQLVVDEANVHSLTLGSADMPPVLSLLSLLRGEIDASALAGRVVIIGYDGAGSPTVATPRGRMQIHRFFVLCLAGVYRSLGPVVGSSSASSAEIPVFSP